MYLLGLTSLAVREQNYPPHGLYINTACFHSEAFCFIVFEANHQSSGTFTVGAMHNGTIMYDGATIPYKYDECRPDVISVDQCSSSLDLFLETYHLDRREWEELKYNSFYGLVTIMINGTEIIHVHN
ncbi:hypothetical protein FOL47_000055 [Perkinsus chesapeaki]|uniref:Uncharacterized protein n=1 Tax=Perkinsus chesapeaki TaxID=330153 RepID=A0A7J6N3M2_PERCH|nr:hypothetical protein FOL47_000055 [Perkinsus chesapeaki]